MIWILSDLQIGKQIKGIDATDKYDDETIAAMPDGASHPFLFKGDGKLSFKEVSERMGYRKNERDVLMGFLC